MSAACLDKMAGIRLAPARLLSAGACMRPHATCTQSQYDQTQHPSGGRELSAPSGDWGQPPAAAATQGLDFVHSDQPLCVQPCVSAAQHESANAAPAFLKVPGMQNNAFLETQPSLPLPNPPCFLPACGLPPCPHNSHLHAPFARKAAPPTACCSRSLHCHLDGCSTDGTTSPLSNLSNLQVRDTLDQAKVGMLSLACRW